MIYFSIFKSFFNSTNFLFFKLKGRYINLIGNTKIFFLSQKDLGSDLAYASHETLGKSLNFTKLEFFPYENMRYLRITRIKWDDVCVDYIL